MDQSVELNMQNHYINKVKLITILLKNSGGISSKRVISLLGTFICFSLLIVGFITGKEIPDFAEVIFIGCLSLYGVEIIPNFRRNL